MAIQTHTIVSAPGKVLLTGAYLILERPNSGLVLSTSARFYSIVSPLFDEYEIEDEHSIPNPISIDVHSPQLQRITKYKFSFSNFELESNSTIKNPFVEESLKICFAFIFNALVNKKNEKNEIIYSKLDKETIIRLKKGIKITILGDNDFYSHRKNLIKQNLPLSSSSLSQLKRFSSITENKSSENDEKNDMNAKGEVRTKPELSKTGLGSSAAMTTSVIASLLLHFHAIDQHALKDKIRNEYMSHGDDNGDDGDDDKNDKKDDNDDINDGNDGNDGNDNDDDLNLVHFLSQVAHSFAQGKIGSGFDIATSAFGSQRYVRFSPSIISSITQESSNVNYVNVINKILEVKWDHSIQPYSLPPNMILLIGEPGHGGSSTTSMVKNVQKWKMKSKTLSTKLEKFYEKFENLNQKFPKLSSSKPIISRIGNKKDDVNENVKHDNGYDHGDDDDDDGNDDDVARVWLGLAESNRHVELGLKKLCDFASENIMDYEKTIWNCSNHAFNEWENACIFNDFSSEVVKNLLFLRKSFMFVRQFLKEMGEKAQVDIEPPSQTRIINATMDMKGCLFSGVPGAGGFDAIFAICLDSRAKSEIESLWVENNVLPMCCVEDARGVRCEDAQKFPVELL